MTGFGAPYTKFAQDVYHFALYLSGERGEAEDITSETFVRAWGLVRDGQSGNGQGLSVHDCPQPLSAGTQKKSRQVALDENLRDPQASSYAQVAQKAELRAVLARLQKLPEIDRAALLMRAFDEMPYDEIARAPGISLPAVKVKIHRARLALADIRNP
jgi:RNA polymerase sigma-70 factor, ECF subfamily